MRKRSGNPTGPFERAVVLKPSNDQFSTHPYSNALPLIRDITLDRRGQSILRRAVLSAIMYAVDSGIHSITTRKCTG